MKKLVASVITILILVLIYSRVDWHTFLAVCSKANLFYLAIAATFFFLTTFLSIIRWKLLLKEEFDLPLRVATKIFLAAMSLNSITPSKLGDLTKAYFLKKESSIGYKRGFDTVFLEKLLDLSSLCFLFLLGAFTAENIDRKLLYALLIFSAGVVTFTFLFIALGNRFNPLNYFLSVALKPFPKIQKLVSDTEVYLAKLKRKPALLAFIIGVSLVLWSLHLIQIYFFFLTLGARASLIQVFGYVPAAILIGLMPLTIGGMGTRDAALIYLFSDRFGYETMAAIGILVSTRYWVPSLVGLPFLRSYLAGGEKDTAVANNKARRAA